MKRHFLALLLSLAMIMSLLPVTAMAEDGQEDEVATQEAETPVEPATSGECGATEDDSLTWALTKNDGAETYTLTISGEGAMADYTVGGAPWHVALGAAAHRKLINKIELPNGLTRIGDNAFLQAAVTTVEIPNTVKSIGTNAFWNCNTIQTTLPAGVQELGVTAFYGTFTVNVDENSQYFISEEDGKVIYNKDKTTLYQVSQDFVGTFEIPNTVTDIYDYALSGCNQVKGPLVIPDNVRTIGNGAFTSTTFNSLTLGGSVEEIGNGAFQGAEIAGVLTFPDSVGKIGNFAFSNCKNVTGIELPETSVIVNYGAFSGDTAVSKISIPLSNIQFDKAGEAGYYIFTQYTTGNLKTLIVGTAPEESGMNGMFSNSLSGLEILVVGTGVSKLCDLSNTQLKNGLYPSTAFIDSWNTKVSAIATKYTVADGAIPENGEKAMLVLDTPVGQTCPEISYTSSNENVITIDADGTMHAVGKVGETATITAKYDGTPFAKVNMTIGATKIGDDIYSVYPTIADQTYTGSALEPAVKVTKNNIEITEGFTVEYTDNTDVGTATATVKVGDTVIGTATFNIVKATPDVKITADPTSLVGGGKVTLTVSGAPAKVVPTCEGVTVTENSDGTFSAVLPNRTAIYTFTVSYEGDANHEEASAVCTVSVTRRHSSPSAVTPEPTPEPTPEETVKFVDVSTSAYYYDAVKWAVENGVTNGLSATTFGPYESCTRAQIVTFLWRAAGSPEPKAMSSFTDVPATSYYAKAVAWAVENGITNGMTETTFAPDATCTRGQSVTFLYRALKGTASGSTNFTDVAPDAFYADAVNWAVANNVTNGTSATTFSPNADCTRAEIVTFLYRAYQGK